MSPWSSSFKSGRLGVRLQVQEAETVQLLRQDRALEKLLEFAGYTVQSLSIHLAPQPAHAPGQATPNGQGFSNQFSSAGDGQEQGSSQSHKGQPADRNADQRPGYGRTEDVAAAILLRLAPSPPQLLSPTSREREMTQAAKKYDIPLGILFAVGLTETGIGGHLHANALNLQGDNRLLPQQAASDAEIPDCQVFRNALDRCGLYAAELLLSWRPFLFRRGDVRSYKNVDYAARFLKELKQSEGSWTLRRGPVQRWQEQRSGAKALRTAGFGPPRRKRLRGLDIPQHGVLWQRGQPGQGDNSESFGALGRHSVQVPLSNVHSRYRQKQLRCF